MTKAGIYHTDTDPTEISDLEAVNLSLETINVGIITANSGIYTSIVSTNIDVGIMTASNSTFGISGTTDSPPNNYQLKFYLLTDNQLTVSVRGSDGTIRTGIVSLT